MTKKLMYFKNELEYSKGSDHVTDDIVPLFGHYKNYQGRTLLSYKVQRHVIKRSLSTALGPDFFAHVHCPLKF